MSKRKKLKLNITIEPGDIVSANLGSYDGASWEVLDPPYLDYKTLHARLRTYTGGKENPQYNDGSYEQPKIDWDMESLGMTIRVISSAKDRKRKEDMKSIKESHDYYTQLTAMSQD